MLEKRHGRALCESLSRPRTHNLAHRFVDADRKAMLDQCVQQSATLSREPLVMVEPEQSFPLQEEEGKNERRSLPPELDKDSTVVDEIQRDNTIVETKKRKKRKNRSAVDKIVAVDVPRKESRQWDMTTVQTERSPKPKPPPLSVSTLKEGEASVDDIMSYLC